VTPVAALPDLVAEHETDFILALFTTLAGKPCAKLVPAASAGALGDGEMGFAGFAAGWMGQEPKDPDLLVLPDPASFTPLPFIKKGLALVHCDPHVEGVPWHYSPRIILQRVLEQTKAAGFDAMVGTEIEYFLVRRDAAGELVRADPADAQPQPCYDARDVTRMFDHLADVSRAMNTLGWGNYANDHEDANGQFEQNFAYADALTTADRVITGRYVISMIAEQRDMIATFMPKPFVDLTGSGMHMHMSLWDGDKPAFPVDGSDVHGLGLSETAHHFVGGILEHAPALQAVLAPIVNSYKRTRAASPTSGASWSPNLATWGGNDRTHYLRVPDGNRVELRGGDGAANPYLAMAAALAAGMDGVERQVDPGAPGDATNAAALPSTLIHAIDALAADDVVRGALDAAGPGVADWYAEMKTTEFTSWHSQVTPWEIERYLRAF